MTSSISHASAHAAALAFSGAVAAADEQGAEAACVPSCWASSHGDNPQRLYRKASHPRRGMSLQVIGTTDDVEGRVVDRAAVDIALMRGDRELARIWLLCASTNEGWQVAAASEDPTWRHGWLRGQIPALLLYEALPLHEDAANGAVAIVALGQRSMAGVAEAGEVLGALMNEDEGAAKVIAQVQHLAVTGHQLRVRDARWLSNLGRAVVRIDVVPREGGVVDGALILAAAESLWVHVEVGPPLRWLRAESTFRPAQLLLP